MAQITLPPTLETMPAMEATLAGADVTSTVRGAATALSDVTDWSRAHGAPARWTGDAAEKADHALTRFAKDTDAVVAALEIATAALDVYVDQVRQLTRRHSAINADIAQYRTDLDDLRAYILNFGEATPEELASMQSSADRLASRRTHLVERVTGWETDLTAAEDRVIRELESVDETGEGRRAADAPGRVDTAALMERLAAIHTDPDAVNRWWNSLTPAEQEALKISDPDAVGNTNGIPTDDRDEANRTSLERDLEFLEGLAEDRELTAEEQRWLTRAEAAQKSIDDAASKIDRNTGLPVDTNLMLYLPKAYDGDGIAAIAYGNPDTADNTAVVVPGILNDGSTIASQGEDAFRLFENASLNGESAAVIAWDGYDNPTFDGSVDWWDYLSEGGDMGSVLTEGEATEGGTNLANFVDGLRVTDTGERSHLSVIGHSYGSTTAAHAAADHGLDADSLTLIGSPGAGDGNTHVSDLGMPEGRVYAGAADNDFVSWLGGEHNPGLGQDPTQDGFGAQRFDVDPGERFHVDSFGVGIENHTSYFDAGSSSLDNLTAITQGDEPNVIDGRTDSARDHALDWVKDETEYQVDRGLDEVRERAEDVGREISEGVDEAGEWAGDRWDDVTSLWP